MVDHGAADSALTVSAYLARINQLLATQGGRVRGEVTSISPSAKALYFSLKDQDGSAILNCLIWRSIYEANSLELKIGDEIIVTGVPDIYPQFGRFTFKADTIEYAGEGALKKAYERLKTSLGQQGLLQPERKRPLPAFPKKIGVITSLAGAAIHDFSTNLGRYGFKVTTVDARVEGKAAIHELLAAVRAMSLQDIEVLVIVRGGGSWESLEAFNTESLVMAIADFKVPVVTGIGHEIDLTLAEMVADLGCSTPTAAAEALNQPWDRMQQALDLRQHQIISSFRSLLQARNRQADYLSDRLLRQYDQQLGNAKQQLSRAGRDLSDYFSGLAQRVRAANASLLRASGIMRSNLLAKRRLLDLIPAKLSANHQAYVTNASRSLEQNFKIIIRSQSGLIERAATDLAVLEKTIAASDPKRNMRLGYSLSYVNGKLARSAKDVSVGSKVTTQLVDGEFTSEVKTVK